jgi:GNAT superfamily N-acetyltransferase
MIALELPDIPRWVEAHGIAGDPAGWRVPVGEGFAVGHDAMRLIVIAGEADQEAVTKLVDARPSYTFLAATDYAFRTKQRAILHTLPDPDGLPELDGALPLPADVALPEPLAEELAWARTRGAIWSAWVDGAPVAFAYAPWRSAKYFDVSVDVLPEARQLGLATLVAAAMIRDERAAGREPVWGADEANVASLRLAKRLGFEPADELWVAPP